MPEIKLKPEPDLEKYQDGYWKHFPLYKSPVRPAFTSISAPDFRTHLRKYGVSRKKKSGSNKKTRRR